MRKQEISKFLTEWDSTCQNVLLGIKKLGHDIPITGYDCENELKEMRKMKRDSGISKKAI